MRHLPEGVDACIGMAGTVQLELFLRVTSTMARSTRPGPRGRSAGSASRCIVPAYSTNSLKRAILFPGYFSDGLSPKSSCSQARDGCVKVAVPENSKAAGRGGELPATTVEGGRPQHRTAAMKDQAALNPLSELRRGRHLVVGERDRHAPLRQLNRQRRRDRQPVFGTYIRKRSRARWSAAGSATRARIVAAAAFVAARSNGLRETIDHRIELDDQPACHVRLCAHVLRQRNELGREMFQGRSSKYQLRHHSGLCGLSSSKAVWRRAETLAAE